MLQTEQARQSSYKALLAKIIRADVLALVVVSLLSFGLFSYNNDFKIGLHDDERAKIIEALTGYYYYAHPLLLPQAMHLIKELFNVSGEDPQTVALIGRSLSAFMAAVGVACLFVLLRKSKGLTLALLGALAAATPPLLAMHAHYIKEDATLFGFCCLSVLVLSRLLTQTTPRWIISAGLCIGLTASSKAVGLFLIPVYFLAIFTRPANERKNLLKAGQYITEIAIITLIAINSAAFLDWKNAALDISASLKQAVTPLTTYHPFGFYFSNTLLPDMGLPLCALAVSGLFLLCQKMWEHRLTPEESILVPFAIIFYLMIELSPYKTWPDFEHLALPLLVPFTYCAIYATKRLIDWLCSRPTSSLHRIAACIPLLFILGVLPQAWQTIRLLQEIKNDTRIQLNALLGDKEKYTVSEHYSSLSGRIIPRAVCYSPSKAVDDARYLVTSSFAYDMSRYRAEHSLPGVPPALAGLTWSAYTALHDFPYCVLKPAYRSYAFSNPTLEVFSLLAINRGQKADPATNGRPCTTETINQLPVEDGYKAGINRTTLLTFGCY